MIETRNLRNRAVPSLILALLLIPAAAPLADAHRHTAGQSLVRCTLLRRPATHASRIAFAPTRPAIFFARAGDRCVWRHGSRQRG